MATLPHTPSGVQNTKFGGSGSREVSRGLAEFLPGGGELASRVNGVPHVGCSESDRGVFWQCPEFPGWLRCDACGEFVRADDAQILQLWAKRERGHAVAEALKPGGGLSPLAPYAWEWEREPLPATGEVCPRWRGRCLVHRETGKVVRLGCNRYDCPVCGKRKQKRLRKYVERCLRGVAHVRFWSFTLTNRFAESPEVHYRQLGACWQAFITEIRRKRGLPEKVRRVRYIRVVEPHKSGAFHYHVLADTWADWHVMQALWERCCQRVLGVREHVGWCWVKYVPTKAVARYVVKYVTKAAAELPPRKKRWAKSRGFPAMREVFPVEPTEPGAWVLAWVSALSGELILKGEAITYHVWGDSREFWAETLSGEMYCRGVLGRVWDRAPP